jgi:hypothetical protein
VLSTGLEPNVWLLLLLLLLLVVLLDAFVGRAATAPTGTSMVTVGKLATAAADA